MNVCQLQHILQKKKLDYVVTIFGFAMYIHNFAMVALLGLCSSKMLNILDNKGYTTLQL